MPPTDKALAVMTKSHIDALAGAAILDYKSGAIDSGRALREIHLLVRYLVDHPERLAGEGQVIVDREEIEGLALVADLHRNTGWPVSREAFGKVIDQCNRWLAQEKPK